MRVSMASSGVWIEALLVVSIIRAMSETKTQPTPTAILNMTAVNHVFVPGGNAENADFGRIGALQAFEHRLQNPPKKHPDAALEPPDLVHDAWVRIAKSIQDPNKAPVQILYPKALAFKRVQQAALSGLARSKHIPIHEDGPTNEIGLFGSLGHLKVESAMADNELQIELIQMTEDIKSHPKLIDAIGALFSDENGFPIFESHIDKNFKIHLSPQAVIYCKLYTELIDMAEKTQGFTSKAVLAYLHNITNVPIEHTMKFLGLSRQTVFGLRSKSNQIILGEKEERNNKVQDKFGNGLRSIIGLLKNQSTNQLGHRNRFFTPIYEMSTAIQLPNLSHETVQAANILLDNPELQTALNALNMGGKSLHKINAEGEKVLFSPSAIWFCRLYGQLSLLEKTYNHFGMNNIIAHLHKLAGLNVPESATILGQTENSIASLRSRIKQQLEIILTDQPEIGHSIQMYKIAMMMDKN